MKVKKTSFDAFGEAETAIRTFLMLVVTPGTWPGIVRAPRSAWRYAKNTARNGAHFSLRLK
ncbi:hypothetical protein [Paraburkholderia antibiotica]|uniref:Uncharacterized protein n=1 Tax=Paraburkholderia antibiotica TaxID=2728839 RepID=A0A7X9X6G3_9BURK|nr:hypothetical protein [Paraburkholderia antibiotica]NML31812.1 hypothetical protein [Paraburkholderia antibiotica]